MKKSIVYGLGLLAGVAGLNGMDNEQPFPFFELPSEVGGVIINFALDAKQKSYRMENSRFEQLCIPYTLRPINPIVSTNTGDAVPETWEPKEGTKILLDHQLWFQAYDGSLRLDHDTANNHDNIKLGDLDVYKTTIFDGINRQRCALFITSKDEKSNIFFLRQSPVDAEHVDHKHNKVPLRLVIPGYIQSVMLHPDENRIMYSFKAPLISDAMDVDTENKKNDSFYYGLSLIDVDDTDKKNTIAYQTLDILIDKTIYLGGNRYLGLTIEGKLAHIWLNEDNMLRHSMISLTKYDNDLKKNVLSDSVVKDIAVDDSYRTKTGLRLRIAYITNKGEVFVMDLSLFKKPTPLLNMIVASPENVFRLFYDKGELAVLCRDKFGTYQNFVRWPDNLGALYLKTVLAQQERENKHS